MWSSSFSFFFLPPSFFSLFLQQTLSCCSLTHVVPSQIHRSTTLKEVTFCSKSKYIWNEWMDSFTLEQQIHSTLRNENQRGKPKVGNGGGAGFHVPTSVGGIYPHPCLRSRHLQVGTGWRFPVGKTRPYWYPFLKIEREQDSESERDCKFKCMAKFNQ